MKIYLNSSDQSGNPYSYAGTNEKAQMERLVKAVHEKLQAYDCTSYINTASGIWNKAVEAARLGCDVSIAHHTNAGGGRGTQAYYHPNQARGKSLSTKLVAAIDNINPEPKTHSRIVNGMLAFGGSGYGDVREPANRGVVGILFEVLFHDNPTEAKFIVENIDKIAEAEVKAIAEEYGLKLKKATGGSSENTAAGTLFRVQVGAFGVRANADAMEAKLKAAGYPTYLVQLGGLFKVQTGAFKEKANAERLAQELKSKGFAVYITTESGVPAAPATGSQLSVGDRVRVNVGAKTYEGQTLADFVYRTVYTVLELNKDRAVIGIDGRVTAAVDTKDLSKA